MFSFFPFRHQLDSMGCGASCICMITAYYHREVSYHEISRLLRANSAGVSLLALESILTSYGFDCDSFITTINDLKDIEFPAILHWNQNHFVVLYRISDSSKKFYIADPGKGKKVCTLEEFVSGWISTEVEGQPAGVVLTAKPKVRNLKIQPKGERHETLRFLWEYVKVYKRHFVQIIAGLLLGCILQLILPFLTQSIVDVGIKQSNIPFIWLVLLGELMIVIGRTATDFIRRWLLLHISMRINISLVSDFFIKLLKLPMSYFDTKLMGDMMQRINDHTRIESFLTGQTLSILFNLLTIIVFSIVLFIYNNIIFAVFLGGSFLYGIWMIAFLNRRKVLDYDRFEKQAINQERTYQFISTIQEVKLQNCERRRRWEWEDTQADLFITQMKSLKLQQLMDAGSVFINELKNIIITVLAATAVIRGDITLGAMLAIQYIIGQLNSPIEQLMSFIFSFQDVKISLERINEVHKEQNEETSENQLKHFPNEKDISINNLIFRYDRFAVNPTLDNISLNIPNGKVTAIVGASGSGKTTLIKLILGYYPTESGEIHIAGENINSYNLRWWRSKCGVVLQDGVIFSESIARNIAVNDNEIDWDRLKQAAKLANIDKYIESLPLGYNTTIGRSGMGLSQGQKQRILIARAVYRNPDFIFLDEATNALDADNERLIVENLNTFYKGRTVIVVAHRLSTVMNADQIIVLDSGRITELGNHESLIKAKGVYYKLIKNQLTLGE